MFDDNATRVVAAVVGALALFAFGFLVGRYTINEEPTDPALGLAQSAGVSIPAEQEAAFFDGVVTTEEVTQAAERFKACAIKAGAEDFDIDVSDFGWEVSVKEFSPAVGACETRFFRTTQLIWRMQRQPNGESDSSVTTSVP